MNQMQKIAKTLGPDIELAAALWDTGYCEARLLTACMVPPSSERPSVRRTNA